MMPEVDLLPAPREFLKIRLPGNVSFEFLDKWQAQELFEQLYVAITLKWGTPKSPE